MVVVQLIVRVRRVNAAHWMQFLSELSTQFEELHALNFNHTLVKMFVKMQ